MPNIIEVGGQLEKARADYKSLWESFPVKTMPNGESARDIPSDQLKTLRDMQDDINRLGEEYDGLRKLNDFAPQNDADLADGRKVAPTPKYGRHEVKTLGDFAKEAGVKAGYRGSFDADIDAKAWMMQAKATMTTSANGYPPEVLRDGTVVPAISRPPQLIDFLRIEPTTQNAIKFMAQTVRTDATLEKSEGSALDEDTITYAEQTDIISRIGSWIPVTEEQLEDEPELRTLVEQDLALMCRQRLDLQATVGTGVDPLLLGIYASTNYQTQAVAALPPLDAWLRAATLVRVNGRARPNVAVMHSTDHTLLALTRTADGLYVLGNPSDGPIMRVWGLPIALSEALTVTTGMVVDTDYFAIKMRKGVTIAISDSHASNFIANTIVIRAHIRAGIKHMRGQAVCRVTGLPAA